MGSNRPPARFDRLGNTATRIRVMPPEYQWLRLQGEPPERAIVMHWTGSAGKERIRQKIAAGRHAQTGNAIFSGQGR